MCLSKRAVAKVCALVTLRPRTLTSPTSPFGSAASPSSGRIAISTLVPLPTEPALCGPRLGSGLEEIWWAASVIAYASSTGAPNSFSSDCRTEGGSEAEQDRMKRTCGRPAAA